MEILIISLLVFLNGFFAMAEIAVLSSKKSRLQEKARSGSSGAKTALKLLEKPEDFLSSVQVGITLIGIFAGAFGGVAIAEDLVPFFEQYNSLRAYAAEIAFVTVVGIITYFSLIIGELVPKSIAFNNPESIASFAAPIMYFISVLAKPVVIFLSWSTLLIQKILFIKPKPEQPVSEEELKIMIEHGAKFGSFDKYEAELVKSIFRFGDRDAYSIMTNRQDVVWIDINDPAEEIQRKIQNNKFSNYPVCEKTMDNIIGIVNTHTLLTKMSNSGEFNLKELVFDPVYLPDTLQSFKIIERFKAANKYVGVVIDEFGSVEGIITKQDLLENIIGELPEPSASEASPSIIRRNDGSWLVSGALHVDELAEKTEINPDVNEDEFITLGGFVMAVLGKIPSEGDHFEYEGYSYEVIDMDGKRVDKVLIKKLTVEDMKRNEEG